MKILMRRRWEELICSFHQTEDQSPVFASKSNQARCEFSQPCRQENTISGRAAQQEGDCGRRQKKINCANRWRPTFEKWFTKLRKLNIEKTDSDVPHSAWFQW
ncbi:hypothetical protein NPIL_322881 [Nephila pilipes]|uniref:Uncharacterized protein n=1 Tax=Nephila pilipes TaxID=299642 RepID=A0A8X6PCN1_NEPPI|nr:hypothetical protein NPIL_322881 [Nephila pilipes]